MNNNQLTPDGTIPGWGAPLPPEPILSVTKTKTPDRRLWQALSCLIVVIISYVFIAGYFKDRARSPTKANPSEVDEITAQVMARQFVEKRLLSPGSASYGGWGDQLPSETVTSLGSGEYRVRGWVDSQNGFGALLRTHFVVELRQVGDKWKLLNVTMHE